MPSGRPAVLVVVATATELAGLLPAGGTAGAVGPYRASHRGAATFVVSGIGPAAAAAATATGLALGDFALAVSAGICGGFAGTAVGDVVVATELVAADLGAESDSGFLGLTDLGWADTALPVDPALVSATTTLLRDSGRPCRTGPVLTVSTVTGTAVRAKHLAERHAAVAEAMEGWGVATAAAAHRVPFAELRAVSNPVGNRDRSVWDIPAALGSLSRALTCLLEGPHPWP